MISPTLVAVAHGTRAAQGQATVEALLARVRAQRPGLRVLASYVEIQAPLLRDVVGGLDAPAVVVPLMLSTGYHVRYDIRALAAQYPRVAVARPLGPHPLLVRALARRVRQAGVPAGVPVVLAAAGSSDPAAAKDVEIVARWLAVALGTTVVPAYASATRPTVAEAVQGLRAAGAPAVAVARYLLAPGHFAHLAADPGAGWVTEPLGAQRAVAELVLGRYDDARAEPEPEDGPGDPGRAGPAASFVQVC